jgi:hypothetical protein
LAAPAAKRTRTRAAGGEEEVTIPQINLLG